MENFFSFYFSFVSAIYVQNEDAPCYARPIYGKGALLLEQFQLARSFHTLLDTLNHFLPLPVVYVEVSRARVPFP